MSWNKCNIYSSLIYFLNRLHGFVLVKELDVNKCKEKELNVTLNHQYGMK